MHPVCSFRGSRATSVKPSGLGPPRPCPSWSHTVASLISHTCPETEMPFSFRTATRVVGPVLYSLSEVPGGAAAARPPGAVPVHPPVWGTGPPTPGPRTGCGGAALLGRCFLQPFRGLLGHVLFRSGLGLLGPRAHCTSCLPPPYLASVCPFVSHVFFAKCKSVCLVCPFF